MNRLAFRLIFAFAGIAASDAGKRIFTAESAGLKTVATSIKTLIP